MTNKIDSDSAAEGEAKRLMNAARRACGDALIRAATGRNYMGDQGKAWAHAHVAKSVAEKWPGSRLAKKYARRAEAYAHAAVKAWQIVPGSYTLELFNADADAEERRDRQAEEEAARPTNRDRVDGSTSVHPRQRRARGPLR